MVEDFGLCFGDDRGDAVSDGVVQDRKVEVSIGRFDDVFEVVNSGFCFAEQICCLNVFE